MLEVGTWWFCGCGLENLVDLMNLRKALQRGLREKKSLSFVGGSASPFIDKGDGFTSEGRMLLSFVAHAGGYKIMVGAYNTIDVTVECQMHVGGCVCLLREW